jgi:hypothetical protein
LFPRTITVLLGLC